jgi:hypothetical protein
MQKVQRLAAENRELHAKLDSAPVREPLGAEECARRVLDAGTAAPED